MTGKENLKMQEMDTVSGGMMMYRPGPLPGSMRRRRRRRVHSADWGKDVTNLTSTDDCQTPSNDGLN